MAELKHIGEFEDCPYCKRYIRLGLSFGIQEGKGYTATTRKLHRIALKRRAEALRKADHRHVISPNEDHCRVCEREEK